MSVQQLSERQRRILRFIAESLDERGYPPTIRELGNRSGISSTSVVDYNLDVLERRGLIRRSREISRGIKLLDTRYAAGMHQPRLVRIPVVGRIAAGVPIEAIEDPADVVELPVGMVPEQAYALRVRGTSMIDDQIDDGDLVVVKPQATVDNGEIAVAIISDASQNGGATLKRFYREGNRVRLQPRNSTMKPIILRGDQVEVRGKVVKLLRDLC